MKKTLSIVMSILMAMAFAAVSVTAPATVSAASAPGALYAYDDADDADDNGQRFQMYDNASGHRFYIDTNGGSAICRSIRKLYDCLSFVPFS